MIEASISPTFQSWRETARSLLQRDVLPSDIVWNDGSQPMLSFSQSGLEPGGEPGRLRAEIPGRGRPGSTAKSELRVLDRPTASSSVPREFLQIAQTVSYHRSAERWLLLYRVLYRLTHGEKNLLKIEVDDDIRQLYEMEKSVRRDLHKMHAFVRFRRVEEDGQEQYLAFHRPDHLIMPAAAPWFARRFANMHWTILTPDASASWDTHNLTFGPGAEKSPVNEDDLETLWRTYYANIFNPARIKIKAMKKEMPVRHWATLPETQLIPDLLREAPARVAEMVQSSCAPSGVGASVAEYIPRSLELNVLREAVQTCHGCELYCDATQPVFGRGPENAVIMFVGEQPSDQEDLAGVPFVGPAGQVFDDALAQAGIDRSQCYVTNAVKHFRFELRGKRRIHSKPSARHVAACKPWLLAEIASVRPRMIVALGSTAANAILGPTVRILRDRGKVFRESELAPWIMPTIHPSALLRMPDETQRLEAQKNFVSDLCLAAQEMVRTNFTV